MSHETEQHEINKEKKTLMGEIYQKSLSSNDINNRPTIKIVGNSNNGQTTILKTPPNDSKNGSKRIVISTKPSNINSSTVIKNISGLKSQQTVKIKTPTALVQPFVKPSISNFGKVRKPSFFINPPKPEINLPFPPMEEIEIVDTYQLPKRQMKNDLKNFNRQNYPEIQELKEEDDEDDDNFGFTETFGEYVPFRLQYGTKHPDPVVETASLSSVQPPPIKYKLHFDDTIIKKGFLSSLQLEAVVYACQRHEKFMESGERAGYLIGDGAGVGKGRTLAALVLENYILGRKKALWLSVSNDLKMDSRRDLDDIGAGFIPVYSLGKFKYDKISSEANGSVKKGVIFATYSSLVSESHNSADGKPQTRLRQILKWFGANFDGLIILDECHKAKNLVCNLSSKSSKTGRIVLELQNKCPLARVVYSSATGATEPKNMAYMARLGMWGKGTPFADIGAFLESIDKRGVGAMELLAMDMKMRGIYIARQLSFHGVTFRTEECALSADFVKLYNASVRFWLRLFDDFKTSANMVQLCTKGRKRIWTQFWAAHQRFFKHICIGAKVEQCVELCKREINNGRCVVIGLQSTGEAQMMDSVDETTKEVMEFASNAKGILMTLVERHFPTPDMARSFATSNESNRNASPEEISEDDFCFVDSSDFAKMAAKKSYSYKNNAGLAKRRKADSSNESNSSDSSNSDDMVFVGIAQKRKRGRPRLGSTPVIEVSSIDKFINETGLWSSKTADETQYNDVFLLKQRAIDTIHKLGPLLPPNTLDYLINMLGGSNKVAEMTGRRGRLVTNEQGKTFFQLRSVNDVPLEILNLTERQRFMDGDKLVAIISEAASQGISLQADRRVSNQRRRVHITLELPWSADKAVQQFGRTHRSNQVSAPEYVFLMSELAGERRFAATVARRLESLGALMHGDRRATDAQDFSQFNIENKHGRTALDLLVRTITRSISPPVPIPADYTGSFIADAYSAFVGVGLIVNCPSGSAPETIAVSRFLNRILGMEVELQNSIFEFFSNLQEYAMKQAKRAGTFDEGIMDLGSEGEKVEIVQVRCFQSSGSDWTGKTELHKVRVERGLIWDIAFDLLRCHGDDDSGFYVSKEGSVLLAVHSSPGGARKDGKEMMRIYRPNVGMIKRLENVNVLQQNYTKVDSFDRAKQLWNQLYEQSATKCTHVLNQGRCRDAHCEVGLRKRTYRILVGSLLSVWETLENIVGTKHSRLQVVRLRTADRKRIIGTVIPEQFVEQLSSILSRDAEVTTEVEESHEEILNMPTII